MLKIAEILQKYLLVKLKWPFKNKYRDQYKQICILLKKILTILKMSDPLYAAILLLDEGYFRKASCVLN